MTKEEYQKKIDELNEQKDALKAQIEQVKKRVYRLLTEGT